MVGGKLGWGLAAEARGNCLKKYCPDYDKAEVVDRDPRDEVVLGPKKDRWPEVEKPSKL